MKVQKFFSEMARVWKVTRKPQRKDYFMTLRIVLIGFLIIGLIGFVMELLWQFLLKRLFV